MQKGQPTFTPPVRIIFYVRMHNAYNYTNSEAHNLLDSDFSVASFDTIKQTYMISYVYL